MTNKNLYLIYQYRKRNDAYHHKLAELKYLGKLIAHAVKKKKKKSNLFDIIHQHFTENINM